MVLKRLYDMARYDSDETFEGRRDFLKLMIGAAVAEETGRELQGKGDATTAYDALTHNKGEETLGRVNIEVSYGPDENVDNHSTAEGHETQQTQDEQDIIKDYESFVRGLEYQDQESLGYVEGALDQDPRLVNKTSIKPDGLHVDSVVAEWSHPKMDESMEEYLRGADQSGDLGEWLSRYEKENL